MLRGGRSLACGKISRGWHPQQKGQEIILHLEQSPSSNNPETGVLEDIVLAFHPPHLRQYTEFAIA
ncbi:MAG: hypothetical protein ACRC62_27890 [Microcoleus sp.]